MARRFFLVLAATAALASGAAAMPTRLNDDDQPMKTTPVPQAGAPVKPPAPSAAHAAKRHRASTLMRCRNPRTGRAMKCLPRIMAPQVGRPD